MTRPRDVRDTEKSRAALLRRLAAIYIPDFIIVMCEPCIMCIIAISHPRVPSLAIAEFTIARWPFMIPFLGLSGMAPIIVVIFNK